MRAPKGGGRSEITQWSPFSAEDMLRYQTPSKISNHRENVINSHFMRENGLILRENYRKIIGKGVEKILKTHLDITNMVIYCSCFKVFE